MKLAGISFWACLVSIICIPQDRETDRQTLIRQTERRFRGKRVEDARRCSALLYIYTCISNQTCVIFIRVVAAMANLCTVRTTVVDCRLDSSTRGFLDASFSPCPTRFFVVIVRIITSQFLCVLTRSLIDNKKTTQSPLFITYYCIYFSRFRLLVHFLCSTELFLESLLVQSK